MQVLQLLFALLVASSMVSAANHCVCNNDPYGANGVCDYGCIHAPCDICAEMCQADGGVMATCATCTTAPCPNSPGCCDPALLSPPLTAARKQLVDSNSKKKGQ